MECLLCTMWARMPYAQKYTTPTSAQETEGAMVVGYWIASRAETVVRLCERHMYVLEMLDRQDNQRIENEKAIQIAAQRSAVQLENFTSQTSALQQRRQLVLDAVKVVEQPSLVVPMPVVPIISHVPTQNSGAIPQDFKLGPGPLANENIVTAPPPLPIEADPAQVYRSVAKPGTPEAALEMAKLIPIEGAKVTHPCPSCGVAITTGEVHAC